MPNEIEIEQAVQVLFDTTIDLFDSDIPTEEQTNILKEITPFIQEDLGGQRTVITYFDELISRKTINTLIDRIKLLNDKKILKGVYKSFRYGILEKKQALIWFLYLNDEYKDWSNDWINEYLQDEGGNLDPDDQDWI